MAVLFLFLIFSASFLSVQSVSNPDTDFSCSANSTATCQTYVTYRVQSPDNFDLESISNLFGVSRSDIANASHLTSENAKLLPHQLLLIPIKCSCNGSFFFSNVTYKIKRGDTFYSVSINAFENLTNFQYAQEMNPSSDPFNLTVGADVVFPLLCKCPDQSAGSFPFLLTYVWQPGDGLVPVSSMFNTSPEAIDEVNSHRNFTDAICLPVLIPVHQPIIMQSLSPLGKSRNRTNRVVAAALSVSLSLFLILLAFLLLVHLLKKRKKALGHDSASAETPRNRKSSGVESCESKSNQDKIIPGVSGYLGKLLVYDTEVIIEATSNFNEDHSIGGCVYKAEISNQMYAVKKTKDGAEELSLLQKVNHGNLMKLVGISLEDEKTAFLVFEYAENGSLDKWLFHHSPSCSSSFAFLTWHQRLNIASDVANGLQYLHEHTQPSVVHRDIRTSNILLDSKFKAKIANFALAKPATSPSDLSVDVFAFGVVLLELLSGRKSMETKENGGIAMLWKEIQGVPKDEEKKEERLRNWMDPALRMAYPFDGAMNLVTLAIACTSERALERPTMAEIVFNICLLSQTYSDTCEGFFTFGDPDEAVHFVSPITAR